TRKLLNYSKRIFQYFILSRKEVSKIWDPHIIDSDRESISINTSNFIKKYINISEPIYYFDSLITLRHKYDCYIVGSDQCWRKEYSPNILIYFLDFVSDIKNIKRVAFSASFGVDYWQFDNLETITIKKLISKFDGISVREKKAVELCKANLQISVEHTLDPTMLLQPFCYTSLLKRIENKVSEGSNEQELLIKYILDDNVNTVEIIQKIESISNKKSLNINSNKKFEKVGRAQINDCIYPSVENWLGSISKAGFIITDSFHGTVFSIIFNKPFLTILNKGRGASRIESLLTMFELTDRIVYSPIEISNELLIKNIDYNNVNRIIKDERDSSLDFLKNSLS
ncbi:MAG: polysaccharide pyruvyl transferase family protein, partial [Muribaculaceae bacterium]